MTDRIVRQVTAVRVTGDPINSNNGLFYIHSDHPSALLRTGLGNASVLTKLGGAAYQAVADIQDAGVGFPDRPALDGPSGNRWGFAGGNFSNWQKSRSGLSGEEFADMGTGWRYNQWETLRTGGWSDDGRARGNFMNVNMALWLDQMLP